MVDDLLAWERLGESWDEAVGKGTGGAAFDFFALVEVFEDFGCGGWMRGYLSWIGCGVFWGLFESTFGHFVV